MTESCLPDNLVKSRLKLIRRQMNTFRVRRVFEEPIKLQTERQSRSVRLSVRFNRSILTLS